MDAATDAGGAVFIAGGSKVDSTGGAILIQSGSAANGNRALGVTAATQSDNLLIDASHISEATALASGVTIDGEVLSGVGTIGIKGQSDAATSGVAGAQIRGAGSLAGRQGTVASTTGNITITGSGQGAGLGVSGVQVVGGGSVLSAGGAIVMSGRNNQPLSEFKSIGSNSVGTSSRMVLATLRSISRMAEAGVASSSATAVLITPMPLSSSRM